MINAKHKAIEILDAYFSIDPPQSGDFNLMSQRLYKHTSCGAWISESVDKTGIAIGSIVEGSDIDCETHEIPWENINDDTINKAIECIEDEAEQLWNDANECIEDEDYQLWDE